MKSNYVAATAVDEALSVLATAQQSGRFPLFSRLVFRRLAYVDYVDIELSPEIGITTLRLPLNLVDLSIGAPSQLDQPSEVVLRPALSELLRYIGLSAAYEHYTEVHGHIVSLAVADGWVTLTIVDDQYGYAHDSRVELEVSSPYEGLAFSLMEELDGEVKRRRRLQP